MIGTKGLCIWKTKSISSPSGVIIRMSVVLKRSVAVDIDWRFENMSGGHCISSVAGIYASGDWDLIGQLYRDVIGCEAS